MSILARIPPRTLPILAGFAAACLAVSLLAHALVAAWTGLEGFRSFMRAAGPMQYSVPALALLAGIIAFVPAGIGVFVAEWRGIRSWLHFAATGAAAGGFAILLAWLQNRAFHGVSDELPGAAASAPGISPGIALAVMAAGILGGVVYWALAGRTSGSRRGGVSGPAPSGS